MKLSEKNITQSIRNAEKQGFFNNLNRIYSSIPSGVCQECTKCCRESVNTFYVEFLNIFRNLWNTELYRELKPRIFHYYFLEMVENMPCPFLNEQGKCHIYEYRPLPCRLFGYWPKNEYEANYRRVLQQNKKNYKYFRNTHGIIIPKEVVDYKIQYCENFETHRQIYKRERQTMVDNIFTMESNFFMKGLINEDFIDTSLVAWFIYTCYDMKEAGELRVTIMKEYIDNGQSNTLKKIIDNL